MPDDEGRRRRLGDETKNRIADLASGWSLDDGRSEKPERSDETKERIADLASGWSLDLDLPDDPPPTPAVPIHTPTPKPAPRATPSPPKPDPASASGPIRSKPKTNPPPPPGSPERKALEDKIVETARTKSPTGGSGPITSTSANPVAGEARAKPPTRPPGAPVSSAPSSEPLAKSGPQFRRAGYDGPQAPFATDSRRVASDPHTPRVIVDESISGPIVIESSKSGPAKSSPARPISLPAPAALVKAPGPMPLPAPDQSSIPGLAVPIGEFDSGIKPVDKATLKRDPAEALLKIPEHTTPVEELLEDDDDDEPAQRGDATMIDPQTAKFERGDPTTDGVPDATVIQSGSTRARQQSGGTLRPTAALRRKRGLAGDIRYVFTAVFGVRASRRELAELEHRQGLRKTSRRRHLVTLGRTAVITDSFDHPALGKGREQLQAIEDERSKHAGAVAASDAELERVRRDRETKARQYVTDLGATDSELADVTKKLEPLEKEARVARKRAQELRESLQRVEKKIATTEALLISVKAEKMDKAAIEADIVSFKADRQAVLREEPVIAAELDALNPRIAALEGTRNELRRKRSELEKSEVEDQRRTSELLEAIGAKRKVVERGASDAETARDNALFELGERLYVDRPKVLAAQLAPIDQIDLEHGEGDRRMMELREILSNIDKWKLTRGTAMFIFVLAAFALLVGGLVYALA